LASPSISILMPYRNAADTLPECLASILGQTFADFELLAVDDGSTDTSAQFVRDQVRADSRIRPLRSRGKGLVAALNTGLEQARGEIVARMDADDIMLPDRLRAHMEHFASDHELALSATQVRFFPEDALRAGFREYLRWQNGVQTHDHVASEIYVEAPFAHPSVAYNKALVIGLGGYRHGDFPEDYDLWLRMHEQGLKMAKIPRILLAWRDSGGRLSRTDPRYARDAFDRLRATYLARDPRLRDGGRPLVIWGAGRRTRRRAEHLLGHGYAPAAWIDVDRRKIGNRIGGIPVLGPESLYRGERPFVLVYVANHGIRDLIRTALERGGYAAGRDYLMVG